MTNKELSLEDLKELLINARKIEQDWKKYRVGIEDAILAHSTVARALRDEGVSLVAGVAVTTGYVRKWDQDKLDKEIEKLTEEGYPIADLLSAFKLEYKEQRVKTRTLERENPEVMSRISAALTLTPKRPSIDIKKDKQ